MFKSFSRVFVIILSSVIILNTFIFSTLSVDARSKAGKKATKSMVSKKKPAVAKATKSEYRYLENTNRCYSIQNTEYSTITGFQAFSTNAKCLNKIVGNEQPNYIKYEGNGRGDTKCADGTTSRSADRGTCSKHGGIAR